MAVGVAPEISGRLRAAMRQSLVRAARQLVGDQAPAGQRGRLVQAEVDRGWLRFLEDMTAHPERLAALEARLRGLEAPGPLIEVVAAASMRERTREELSRWKGPQPR